MNLYYAPRAFVLATVVHAVLLSRGTPGFVFPTARGEGFPTPPDPPALSPRVLPIPALKLSRTQTTAASVSVLSTPSSHSR